LRKLATANFNKFFVAVRASQFSTSNPEQTPGPTPII